MTAEVLAAVEAEAVFSTGVVVVVVVAVVEVTSLSATVVGTSAAVAVVVVEVTSLSAAVVGTSAAVVVAVVEIFVEAVEAEAVVVSGGPPVLQSTRMLKPLYHQHCFPKKKKKKKLTLVQPRERNHSRP